MLPVVLRADCPSPVAQKMPLVIRDYLGRFLSNWTMAREAQSDAANKGEIYWTRDAR